MSKKNKEKSLAQLKKRIQDHVNSKIKERKIEEEKRARYEAKLEEGKKRKADWYKSYESEAKKAAQIIWNWYKNFITLPLFQELISHHKEKHLERLFVSKIIDCKVPYELGGERLERQMVGIALSQIDTHFEKVSKNKLVIHNSVKYGSSHQINGVKDLLLHVYPPVLIEIAKTITEEKIWDIIWVR